MKKIEILNSLWDFISIDGFSKEYWKQYEELAKERFFKIGLKKLKKDLITLYNLYSYGYYNEFKYKLYYDVCN